MAYQFGTLRTAVMRNPSEYRTQRIISAIDTHPALAFIKLDTVAQHARDLVMGTRRTSTPADRYAIAQRVYICLECMRLCQAPDIETARQFVQTQRDAEHERSMQYHPLTEQLL